MGGGTWVYLGTFAFDKGCNIYNRVVLTNHSKRRGFVTADAVRSVAVWETLFEEDKSVACPARLRAQDTTRNGLVHLAM